MQILCPGIPIYRSRDRPRARWSNILEEMRLYLSAFSRQQLMRLCPALLLASAAVLEAQPPLVSFLQPVLDAAAVGTQLGPSSVVATAEECAARCLKLEDDEDKVVSMNVCRPTKGAMLICQCSEWGVQYDLQENTTGCAWYRRSIPRDDARALPKVAVQARLPDSGVALGASSLLSKAFVANIEYLRLRADVDAYVFPTAARSSTSAAATSQPHLQIN